MGLFPRQVEAVLAGMPWGPNSNAYIVDPQVGNDSNDGLRWQRPLKTLAAAFAKCISNQNDVVLLVGGPTALNPTAAVVWNKDYTHLVGLSAPIAMGQRCRIVNHADNDLAVLFTLSGSGCIVKNVQFFDGKDKDEDALCVVVTGSRNYFENCFFAGMGHATPAARAGSYSLGVSGSENRFVNCTVGLDTIRRTAASSELVLSGIRNRFEHCDFRTQALAAAAGFLVKVDNSGGDLRENTFEDCLFYNYTENWAAGITEAFDMPAGGATHYVILRGRNQLVGTGLTWADVTTRVYSDQYAPNAGFGISGAPTS